MDNFLVATSEAIPEDFVPTIADRLVILAMEIPHLRLREKELLAETSAVTKQTKARRLLIDARRVDAEVASWSLSLPTEFLFTRMPLSSSSASKAARSYPSNMDIYQDVTTASTWNSWRKSRIQLLKMILECATILNPPGSRSPSPDYAEALATTHELVDDVCSSIPFHLGHHKKRFSSPGFADYPHPPGQAKWPDHFAASGAVGGWLMMPPLAFCSRQDDIPNSQRQWMLEYLTTFMRDPRDMNRGLANSPKSQTL